MTEAVTKAMRSLESVPALSLSPDDVEALRDAHDTLRQIVDGPAPDTEETPDTDGDRGDPWESRNVVVRAIAANPKEWVTATDVADTAGWDLDPDNAGVPGLKELFEAGYVDREGRGVRGDPYRYRLKDPYKREAAQYDPLNTETGVSA